jgi:hypothetical protein
MYEVVMRYLRRSSLLWLVLVGVALIACAGGNMAPAQPSGATVADPSNTQPRGNPGLAEALGALPSDAPLSQAEIAAKRAQAIVKWNKHGHETYTRQQGCVPNSEDGTLSMLPEAGLVTCAVYQFQFLLTSDRPLSLAVVLSHVPQHYYVAVSNYSRQRWDWHAVEHPTGNDFIPLADTEQYINNGGAVYVAVAGYDRDWLTVAQVRLETDQQAPPPVGLSASQGLYANKISLSWTANSVAYPGLDAEGVIIERANNPAGPFVQIVEIAGGPNSYTDVHKPSDPLHNIPYHTPVFYRVRNYTGALIGPPGTVAAGFRALRTITDLVATKGGFADRVRLDWSSVAGADCYEVQCRNIKDGPLSWTTLAAPSSNSFNHMSNDAVLPCLYDTVYEYRVLAKLYADCATDWSNTDSGLRLLRDIATLEASKGSYSDGINVVWSAVDGATGYNLYYKPKWPAAGSYTLLASVSGYDTTEFLHSPSTPPAAPALPGTAYEYMAKAVIGSDESKGFSNADHGFFGLGPWPQFRHDARHTGLSSVNGPHDNASSWDLSDGLLGAQSNSDAVIGPDQSVTVGCSDGNLYTFNPDGSLKWQFQTQAALWGSPAVDRQAHVYASCLYKSESQLVALDADGALLWHYPAGGTLYEGRGITAPTLGPDGRIVAGCMDNMVYMLWSNGLLGWSYNTGAPVTAPPAMADDGTVYAMSSDGVLHALSSLGSWLWQYDTLSASQCAPTIDAAGLIIVGNDAGKLLALNPDGTLAWSCTAGVGAILSGPTLGPGGECYATGASGRLCALDTSHVVDWSYLLSSTVVATATQPAVAADGLIYTGGFIRLSVLEPGGALAFETPMSAGWQTSSPVLGAGLCYMGDPIGRLYAYGSTL